jgi:hypothetical protein
VALDKAAPDPLQRIFHFLARYSNLDVRLLTVQRYLSGDGEILVPQILVSPESEDKPGALGRKPEPYPEMVAAFDAYNASAPQNLRAVGNAPDYRMIHLGPWEGRAHYLFFQNKTWIDVRVGGEPSLADLLAPLEGKPVAEGQGTLVWDPAGGARGKGRLFAQFPVATPANTIAQAMRDVLSMTRAIVTEKLLALSVRQQAAGN